MIPKRIELEGFLGYGESQEIDFTVAPVLCLSGDNGAGKSSVLDGLTWALFGKCRVGAANDVIHRGAKHAAVELEFSAGGQDYRILRSRTSSGKASTQLWVDQTEITGHSVRDTDQKIEQIVGLDYETFTASAFFEQGQADAFTARRPAERKAVLATILRLGHWETVRERVSREARALDKAAGALGVMIADLERKAAEIPDTEKKRVEAAIEFATAEDALTEIRQQLEVARQQEGDYKAALAAEKAAVDAIAKTIMTKRRLADSLLKLESDQTPDLVMLSQGEDIQKHVAAWQEANEKLTKRRDEYHKARDRVAVIRADINRIAEQIEQLEAAGATCPVCRQPISEKHARAEGGELHHESVAYANEAEELSKFIKTHDELLAVVRELEPYLEKDRQFAEIEARAAQRQEQMVATKAELDAATKDHERAEADQVKATAALQGYEALKSQLLNLAEEEGAADRKVTFHTAALARLDERLEALEQAAKDAEEKRSDKEEAESDLEIWKLLITACGPKGVPALIIEQALPELEDRANALLGILSDNRLSIEFQTQRQAATGKDMLEVLDILAEDGAGQRPLETFSGGERFRIDFALRVALSELLASRAGSRIESLFVDEGFGSLDQAGLDSIGAAVEAVRDRFGLMVIITHLPELRDTFDHQINVVRGPNGARILEAA